VLCPVVGEAGQDVGEPSLRIYVIELGGLDQRVEDGGAKPPVAALRRRCGCSAMAELLRPKQRLSQKNQSVGCKTADAAVADNRERLAAPACPFEIEHPSGLELPIHPRETVILCVTNPVP